MRHLSYDLPYFEVCCLDYTFESRVSQTKGFVGCDCPKKKTLPLYRYYVPFSKDSDAEDILSDLFLSF